MIGKLAIAAAILLSGCMSASAPKTAGSANQPLAVIDAHVRTNFTDSTFDQGKVMGSKAELAAEMQRYRVVGAVSVNGPGDRYADLSDLNIVQCVGLPEKVDAAKLDADLASGRYRCVRIDLGYQKPYASDLNYEPAYRLAEKYQVAVVLQIGELEFRAASLFGAHEVAPRHPRVTFVLAHKGNPHTAEQRERTDYLRRYARPAVTIGLGDDPWIRPAAALAYKNANVVLDGSALLVGDMLAASSGQITEYLLGRVHWIFDYVANPKKLMFGSAWPRTEIGPYLEVFKRAIPRRYWQAVFHDNAARVYGLSTRPLAKSQRNLDIQALARTP
jgi:predicted TIM-barrel fold metal-dependent hydrolase